MIHWIQRKSFRENSIDTKYEGIHSLLAILRIFLQLLSKNNYEIKKFLLWLNIIQIMRTELSSYVSHRRYRLCASLTFVTKVVFYCVICDLLLQAPVNVFYIIYAYLWYLCDFIWEMFM